MKSCFLSILLTISLHAAEPFLGSIEATSSAHSGGGKLEYLTNGKMLLIRPAGDGFKRASGLVNLTTDSYTHLQHHNHSYTEIGKLSEWHKIAEDPQHPAPPMREEPVKITASEEKKTLHGYEAKKFTAESRGQTMEIWGCEGLPTFYQWFAFCPEPRGAHMLEEKIDTICREQHIFPLLITTKQGETTSTLFEVTKITPVKAEQKDHPALTDKTYTIPTTHRLMPHPLQEMKRMRAEMEKQQTEQK